MKHYTNRELAEYLLEMQRHNGRAAFRRYFSRNRWRLLLFFSIVALLFAFGLFERASGLCGFIFGFVIGTFFRDRAYFRQLQSVWPFYDRVIDWLKVEKAAGGEPSA